MPHDQRLLARFESYGVVWHVITAEHGMHTACGFSFDEQPYPFETTIGAPLRDDVCGVCEDALATMVPASASFPDRRWRPSDG